MQSLISFLIVILLVVSVHELGHYLAARAFGVRVLRFSVGFGKPLWLRRDAHGTEWVIAPIPLGGYVRMLDRDTAEENKLDDAATLEACAHWKRIIIFFAGPFANFVLSAVLLTALLSGGEVGMAPLVGEVRDGSPAARAGMVAGERLAAVNGQPVHLWRDAELAVLDAAIAADGITLATESGVRYVFGADAVGTDDLETGVFDKLGIYPYDEYIRPQIATVVEDSPADLAGLQSGDIFVAVNEQVVDYWRHALTVIQAHPEQAVTLLMWRESLGGITATATLSAVTKNNRPIGQLGVLPIYDRERLASVLLTVNRTAAQTVGAAVGQVLGDITRTFAFVRLLITRDLSADHLSGPVGIAVQSGEAAEYGLTAWLRFVALISTSLGVLNLLPLPILDGGHIVLSAWQMLFRREITRRYLRVWESIGLALLLMLMSWVIFSDIMRLLQ